MSLDIKKLDIPEFEEVIEITDIENGLHAFIAIHDTTFGPALGGIRFLPYSTREEALIDVLRLAKGMTDKSTLAGLKVGGGKSTVICDISKPKSKAMLHAFAKAINSLEGRYIGAEDMNCFLSDISTLHEISPYILGLPGKEGTGDPARFTVWGVFKAIEATAYYLWGSKSLKGKKILIQGTGGVGSKLLELLFWAEAELYISDIREDLVQQLAHEYGAQVIAPSDVYDFECDIFSPCAQGGILNEKTIAKLRCKAVVGGANNQLLTPEDADRLVKRNIVYAPDFLINVGGVISVASAINPDDTPLQKVIQKTNEIYDRLIDIYKKAAQLNISPAKVCSQTVENLLSEEKEKRNALV